jgi:hypothetical protein
VLRQLDGSAGHRLLLLQQMERGDGGAHAATPGFSQASQSSAISASNPV